MHCAQEPSSVRHEAHHRPSVHAIHYFARGQRPEFIWKLHVQHEGGDYTATTCQLSGRASFDNLL